MYAGHGMHEWRSITMILCYVDESACMHEWRSFTLILCYVDDGSGMHACMNGGALP
jgi:hypothetical protein